MHLIQPGDTYSPLWRLLVPILLLGFALFVTDLTETSLWSDEGWTIAATAESNPAKIITEWAKPDVHPPLFFLELWVWCQFTGDTIFELRYFSVLISLVGIASAYRLGKALFGNRAGIYAALFYALHDLINVLTHEVRHYPQQMLMVTLALWLYWRFWRKPSRKTGVVFALSGAALIYTHYWGSLVLIGIGLHALITRWRRRNDFRRLFWGFAGIGLLYLPWLPILYHQITLERPGGLPHALENSVWEFKVLLFQLVGVPEEFWLVLALLGAMGAFAATPPRWKPSSASLLPLTVVLVAPLVSILLNTQYPTLSFRALAVVVPVVIVLAAHGLAQFRPREQYAVLLFIVLYSLTRTSAEPINRPPWPEIADYLAVHSDSTDVVLLENDTDEHTLVYYLEQTGAEVAVVYTQSTRERHSDEYRAYLRAALAGKNGVWVSQLDWIDRQDIRPELAAMGFVESAPEADYGIYDDRPILLWRLDRPPQDAPRAVFGDELQLLNAETTTTSDGVVVNLLWSPSAVPDQDYTISAKLFGPDGGFITQTDSRPLDNRALTSTWQAGGVYFDSLFIPVEGASPGAYRVGVSVYYLTGSSDPPYVNLEVNDCSDDPNCVFIMVGEVVIE